VLTALYVLLVPNPSEMGCSIWRVINPTALNVSTNSLVPLAKHVDSELKLAMVMLKLLNLHGMKLASIALCANVT